MYELTYRVTTLSGIPVVKLLLLFWVPLFGTYLPERALMDTDTDNVYLKLPGDKMILRSEAATKKFIQLVVSDFSGTINPNTFNW